MTSEGERFHVYSKEQVSKSAQPLNFLGMVDISDPTDPPSFVFPYPEVPEATRTRTSTRSGLGRGAVRPTTSTSDDDPVLEDRNEPVYCSYFHAGLRCTT